MHTGDKQDNADIVKLEELHRDDRTNGTTLCQPSSFNFSILRTLLGFYQIGAFSKMDGSREETPSSVWQETEGSGDDDMDFEVSQPDGLRRGYSRCEMKRMMASTNQQG